MTQWLRGAGLRVESDIRKEKIGYKIREQTLQCIPFQLVVGAKERDERTVSIRSRDGLNLGVLPLIKALDLLQRETEAPDIGIQSAAQQVLLQRLQILKQEIKTI